MSLRKTVRVSDSETWFARIVSLTKLNGLQASPNPSERFFKRRGGHFYVRRGNPGTVGRCAHLTYFLLFTSAIFGFVARLHRTTLTGTILKPFTYYYSMGTIYSIFIATIIPIFIFSIFRNINSF